jgi:methionyl-tRNA formyltransferase
VLGQLQDAAVSLIVLAGYTRLVPATVVRAFEGRVLNIHPALLPAFGGTGMYGTRVHAAVLASGATVSGATVHMVTEEYDRGSIIAQWPVPVLPRDTPATLAQRVLAVEHILYPLVVVDAAERILRNRTTGPDAAPYSNVAAGQDNSVASNDTAAAAQALARSGQEAFLLSDADPAALNRQIASTIRNRQITRYHKGG